MTWSLPTIDLERARVLHALPRRHEHEVRVLVGRGADRERRHLVARVVRQELVALHLVVVVVDRHVGRAAAAARHAARHRLAALAGTAAGLNRTAARARVGDHARAARHARAHPVVEHLQVGRGQRALRGRRHALRNHGRVDARRDDLVDVLGRHRLGHRLEVGELHQRHRRREARHGGVAGRAVVADDARDIARHAFGCRRAGAAHHVAVHRNGGAAVVAGLRRAARLMFGRRAATGRARRAADVAPRHAVVGACARTTADQQGEHAPRHPTTNLSDSSHELLQPVRPTRFFSSFPTRTPRAVQPNWSPARTQTSTRTRATPANLTQGHAV